MATIIPPPIPPQQQRTNQTLLAVVIGIVLVVGMMLCFAVFVAVHVARGIHVEKTTANGQKLVEIESPLGNLRVNGQGAKATVDIQSPFGDLHVKPTADPARIGIDVYPGATLVTSIADSPFHDHHDVDLNEGNVEIGDGNSTGAQVEMSSGNAAMDVEVGEFRTAASPGDVLDYYRGILSRLGMVQRTRHNDGATELKVKISDDNVRAVAVKPGDDGTHFVLVRVAGGQGAK